MKVDIYVHQGQLVVPLDQVNALIKAANPLGNINTDPKLNIRQPLQYPGGAVGGINQQQINKVSELEQKAQIDHWY